MSLKQLVLLAVVTIVVVALGVVVYRQQAKSWDPDSSAIGQVVLPDLPINEVAGIGIVDAEGELALARRAGTWRVTDRYDYPADYDRIRGLLMDLSELKVAQPVPASDTVFERLRLNPPGDAESGGSMLRLDAADGTAIAVLVLGKEHMRKAGDESNPYMRGGWPDGRYIRVPETGVAGLVAEPFSSLVATPSSWLAKDFFKMGPKTRVVLREGDAVVWELVSSADGGDLSLVGLGEDQELDPAAVSAVTNAFSYASFEDVADPALDPAASGLATPRTLTVADADGIQYVLQIGSKTADGRYHLTVDVSYIGPAEPTDPEGEVGADATATAKIADVQSRVQEIQARLGGWVYLVSAYTVDPVIKTVDAFIKAPAEPTPEPEPAGDGEPEPLP